jgi:TolB-like protein/DNA-binding winged helix-turn-helix (wHTH) protein/cytochrome c-type biogenesis protein CcmH/NrfG
MADRAEVSGSIRFAPFELVLEPEELRRNGIRVKVSGQALQVLIVLASEPGRLVTREHLHKVLWPATSFGDFEHGLNAAVNRLREILGDSAVNPKYIETIPRQGYRFIAAIEVEDEQDAPTAEARNGRPRMRAAILGCLLALVVVAAAWFLQKRIRAVKPIRSIAVLPLQNLSGDPNQEYFADGMTDELITELARIPNLRVVSRTSVMRDKGSGKSLRQIAQELGVDAIIEGSVVRADDRVRITTQLIDARDDKHLWAQSFEGQLSDVLSLQDGVAREIASQTKTVLAPSVQSQLASPKHVNPEAHDAYLRGRFFVERRDGKTAATYFRKAISLDSEYAAAHAGLAQALITMHEAGGAPVNEVIPEAIASAKQAIELDPNDGEGYTALGTIDTVVLWDWDAAERNLRRGIELSSNSALAEIRYAIYLTVRARSEEAIAHMRKAVELDPLSFFANRYLGSTLYFGRHYDEALAALGHASEIAPDGVSAVQGWVSYIYEAKGNYDQAVTAELKGIEPYASPQQIHLLRSGYEKSGWKGYREAHLQYSLSRAGQPCVSYEIADDYRALGRVDEAFDWFDRAFDERCIFMIALNADPRYDGIRSDPRFQELLRRMNLVP